ncbi:type II toxin-antitoxin system HicA family toxin [Chryseolinea lacunae]|uniref:Type II toxin-antitoxin system HicA family toxin n=1 Tax=Chryseolinea lacunae TaxID=2801331 RepID=A0ABS1KYE1_9BACT|nr:type II toxin-antitoxin system HicA family toxin [Chryseolinea lacunae]MBL0744429.1 type II toxin-antitoxin system HicA family toxin [Chryseolinea lacunae]
MKPRKTRDIEKALLKKGFEKISGKQKSHHEYFHLKVEGKKSQVFIYLSHGAIEYDKNLMARIKTQLYFTNSHDAENFFDCPLTKEGYIELLRRSGVIQKADGSNTSKAD